MAFYKVVQGRNVFSTGQHKVGRLSKQNCTRVAFLATFVATFSAIFVTPALQLQITRVNHLHLQCNFSARKIATFRTRSKLDTTWQRFFRKRWQKGMTVGYQWVIFPRRKLFTSLLGEPYQGLTLLKKKENVE